MSFDALAVIVRVLAQMFIWIVFGSVILSYFLPPYHPVREALDRIVSPFLDPIRNIMPRTGMIDFSPLVLILAVDLLSRALVAILLSL